MDYANELKNSPDVPEEQKQELEMLAGLQKDIAISGSAIDFINHPFFKSFQNQMNEMIGDSKGEIAKLLEKPGVTIGEIQAVQAGINKIIQLKAWLNSKVMAGRIAEQALKVYEQDTDAISARFHEALAESQKHQS